jgi:hypothetical protein
MSMAQHEDIIKLAAMLCRHAAQHDGNMADSD